MSRILLLVFVVYLFPDIISIHMVMLSSNIIASVAAVIANYFPLAEADASSSLPDKNTNILAHF